MNSNSQYNFLLLLLAGVLVLAFFIFRPFLYTLVFAIVCSIIFQPVFKKFLLYTKNKRGFASILTLLVVIVFVFVPLYFLGSKIFAETKGVYSYLTGSEGRESIPEAFNNLKSDIEARFPQANGLFMSIDGYLKEGIDWLSNNLGAIFSNIAKMVLNIFIFFLSLYYLLKDGPKLKKKIISLSPLENEEDERILGRLEKTINSVVTGSLSMALIQGILSSVGFAIFGVPNAFLFGIATAIASLVPGVGTALVIAPIIFYLFITGQTAHAVGLLVWGVTIVGLVDNFLMPKIVGNRIHIHSMFILLSILGGIGFFGPVGFLIGPIIMSLLFALFDAYFSLIKKIRKAEN